MIVIIRFLQRSLPKISIKKKNCNKEKAKKLGGLLGDSLKKLNIKEIVFDRGKYLYHGKVMALAEGIREKEIIF